MLGSGTVPELKAVPVNLSMQPFEAVKLDRSLMSGLTDDPRSRLMADTIIPFFHKLGQQVVAEGIESREQAKLALHCGADTASRAFTTPGPCRNRSWQSGIAAGKRPGELA